KAVCLVRRIQEVKIWARHRTSALAMAEEMQADLGITCRVAPTIHSALVEADIAVTTTPSETPLVQIGDLHPGLHLIAIGADAERKNEIAPEAVAASRYICDRQQQTRVLGELHHAIASGLIDADRTFVELGQIIVGAAPGRGDGKEPILCDLTGTGAQDTAI